MREIETSLIQSAVRELFIKAAYQLPTEVACRLGECRNAEPMPRAKAILGKLMDNLDAAQTLGLPICQDTGMAVVFVEIGNEVHISGGLLRDAVNAGVREAYEQGYLRKSVVADPLERVNTGDNTPAILHTELVQGDKIRLIACPKGFGCENMSAIKMFNPSASQQDIIDFITQTVKRAGGNPCPPIVVGVGIGGSFEYCAYLAKKALTRKVGFPHSEPLYARLECDILEALNATGVGPQGLGGHTTALAVMIEKYATHIAGLPVAVNINCHAAREAEITI